MPPTSPLRILHFNDVYNIDGEFGAASFATALRRVKGDSREEEQGCWAAAAAPPLVLFSGDAFNPSTISTTTKGKHMAAVLGSFGVDAAAVGNHDLDFGVDVLERRIAETGFPWLLSNVVLRDSGEQLPGTQRHVVLHHGGWTVGVMGIAEEAWLQTLGAVDVDDLRFVGFEDVASQIAAELRDDHGCDFVVALTHARLPQDSALLGSVEGVSLLLGGHDHDYACEASDRGLLVKSGTDFRDLSDIVVCPAGMDVPEPPASGSVTRTHVGTHKGADFTVAAYRVSVAADVAPDADTAELVESWTAKFKDKMSHHVGETAVDIDAVFKHIRTRETNSANLLADLARQAVGADVCVINTGTFRADCVFPAGEPITLGNLTALLPMPDPIVKLAITGRQLLEAIENGLSKVPALEGRFPAVSGVRLQWDPEAPPMHRIVDGSVIVGDTALDLDRTYTCATKAYLADGRDGYDVFAELEVLVDECVLLVLLLLVLLLLLLLLLPLPLLLCFVLGIHADNLLVAVLVWSVSVAQCCQRCCATTCAFCGRCRGSNAT